MRIARDKWMHFGACAVASLVSTMLAVGLAVGKEYGDSKAPGNRWDWMDIAADVAGIAVGTCVRIVIAWAVLR